MHDYLSFIMMIQPINEASLILFDVTSEEKSRIVRQYNRALENAKGEGTDVAQIFLKPLISQYQKWGDPALIFGLCLAREGQFARAEGSLTFAIAGVLGSEQYLTIAQEALRMVREDLKNPPENLPPADLAGKLKSAKMSSGESPAGRMNFQAPILTRAQRVTERPQMASSKERRDILMRSGSVGDEMADDSIDIEDIKSPGEKMRGAVTVLVILAGVILVALLIIFGVLPILRSVEDGGAARDKLDYVTSRMGKHKYDPEVSAIISEYEEHFKTPMFTDKDGNAVTVRTEETTPATTETTPEQTTIQTTESTALTETPPSDTNEETSASTTKKASKSKKKKTSEAN